MEQTNPQEKTVYRKFDFKASFLGALLIFLFYFVWAAVTIFICVVAVSIIIQTIQGQALFVKIAFAILLFGGFSIFAICLLWCSFSDGFCAYLFREDGIWMKKPLHSSVVLPWDCFQEICLCRGGFTTRGERKAHDRICFVKKGEKKNLYGRWKTDNVFHYDKTINFEYTPELYEEVAAACPYPIKDLRETRPYRL